MTCPSSQHVGARQPLAGKFLSWGLWTLCVCVLPARGALVWEQHEGYRAAKLTVPMTGKVGFTLLDPRQTGVDFVSQLSLHLAETNQNTLNGAGVTAGDYDGDGLCDLFFASIEGGCRLYRNRGGWRFEDVTDRLGVRCSDQLSRSAMFADVNGDGHLDLLVAAIGGPNALFLNDGHGHFRNQTREAGLELRRRGCESMAMADVDGDGDLDLYITNYGENSVLRSGGVIAVRYVRGQPVVAGRYASRIKIVEGKMIELGEPDALYLNDGRGRFTQAIWTDGRFRDEQGRPLRAAPWDQGLSVMFRDIDGNGAPDLYVCNDFQTPDRIWLNDGHGQFRALPELALRSTSHFSMAVDFADIDRDGRDDFMVSDMLSRYHTLRMRQVGATNPPPQFVGSEIDRHQVRHNTLFWNRGDLTWAQIANYAHVDSSDWTWSVVFLDVDLDGYEDVLVTTGHAFDTQDLDAAERVPTRRTMGTTMRGVSKTLTDYPPLRVPNVLFRNRGNLTFEEAGARWGFNSTNVSHGLTLADFDNDGDLDVAVNCLWTNALIYRNDSDAPRVAVRLRGNPPNTFGIGARITLRGGAVPVQSQEMIAGGRYLSSDEPIRTFAAGSLTNRMTLEVRWRSGRVSVIPDVRANYLYEVHESGARPPASQKPVPAPQPWFEDVSRLLAHEHVDPPFPELDRQPLLHRLYHRLGPGVCWSDLDHDGRDDLIIGAGRTGKLAVYHNEGNGRLRRWDDAAWQAPAPDDLTGLAAWTPVPGGEAVLLGLSRYEVPASPVAGVLRFDFEPGPKAHPGPALPLPTSMVGPLAVADYDGDGDLDVFVGGRVVPGQYPRLPPSFLLRNEHGQLRADTAATQLFQQAGLVSGALWADLTGDGWPELVLACEWGPVRVYQNRQGQLHDATAALGMDKFLGWWNSVQAGDLDGDGRLDLVAGNWGLNSSYYDPSPESPIRLFAGDFDGNSVIDLIEAWTDWETRRLVPRRDLLIMATGLPAIRARYPTHLAWSQTDIPTLLGEQWQHIFQLQANCLASMVFLNRGDHFEGHRLPAQAQWSPVFGLNVADFDGDGAEDLFLAQNCFSLRLEEPRLDAGRGLLLRGDGQGNFHVVPGQESGIKIYGEQRGSAVGDFDGDGRVDLVVSQNHEQTRLYRNRRARPGLRVSLSGPPANPHAVGAIVRLQFADGWGPARAVCAGSGYWSQDSLTLVMGTPSPPKAIEVRWPGGKVTRHTVPANARHVRCDLSGQVKAE